MHIAYIHIYAYISIHFIYYALYKYMLYICFILYIFTLHIRSISADIVKETFLCQILLDLYGVLINIKIIFFIVKFCFKSGILYT